METSLRVLSLWQAWATLVIVKAKELETRGWTTTHRGPVIIHAARYTKELDWCFQQPGFRLALHQAGYTHAAQLPMGAALGIVDLVDVFRTEFIRDSLSATEREFGNYQTGRFAWRFENVRMFPTPIPMKGMQGLFRVDASYLPAIREQMRQHHLVYGVGLVECPACGRSAAADKEIKHAITCTTPQRVEVKA